MSKIYYWQMLQSVGIYPSDWKLLPKHGTLDLCVIQLQLQLSRYVISVFCMHYCLWGPTLGSLTEWGLGQNAPHVGGPGYTQYNNKYSLCFY